MPLPHDTHLEPPEDHRFFNKAGDQDGPAAVYFLEYLDAGSAASRGGRVSVFGSTSGPARDEVQQTTCHLVGHLWPSVAPG